MKTRIVYPKMWLDEKFAACSVETKLLFMYLITNNQLGLTSYLHITDRQIMFDTGLTVNQLKRGKEELTNLRWVFFQENWVYHNHKCAYIDYEGRDRVLESKANELSLIPGQIKEVINGLITGDKPTLNHKSKTINSNTQEEVIQEIQEEVSREKTEKELQEESLQNAKQIILEKFNTTQGTRLKVFPESSTSGLKYWLTVYSLEDILQAIENIKYHDYWKGKMSMVLMLRMTNQQDQAVDYIGDMLKVKPPLTWRQRVIAEAQRLGGPDAVPGEELIEL